MSNISPLDVFLACLELAPLLVHEVDPPQRVNVQLRIHVLFPTEGKDNLVTTERLSITDCPKWSKITGVLNVFDVSVVGGLHRINVKIRFKIFAMISKS